VFDALDPHGIKVYAGEDAIRQVVKMETIDMVLVALVGFSGLAPTMEAIRSHKPIALANKETLVVAGKMVMRSAAENRCPVIPVDSEHSAIFQCLAGESPKAIEKVILTASGGPFLKFSKEDLRNVTREDALDHPNWNMGNKVTIDSASLMNKGLEVIEARWLFGLAPEQIEVVIHPQSIIHSIVQFKDGSMKAQLSPPDMRLPIQYALTWPERLPASWPRYDFSIASNLTFEPPDIQKFRNLALAFEALKKGGNQPCVLNAANEIAVHAFLNRKIGFTEIPEVNEQCLRSIGFIADPNLSEYIETNGETRKKALEIINKE
jgi:1-deoxy-D-xylulose-5-phosphate reductoisomerase